MWIQGSCAVDVVPSSVNVHDHWVGLPPEVSRNSTANGTTPETGFGVITPFPLKAAFGGAARAAATGADRGHPGA